MAASLQLLLWRVSLNTRNAGIVDVGWACAFTVVTAIFIIAGPAPGGSWAPLAGRSFLIFFQAQALLVAVLAIGFVMPFAALPRAVWPRVLGMIIAVAGVVGETVADHQLTKFKANPANRGRVCDVGLWSTSRHPNYFFEVCV